MHHSECSTLELYGWSASLDEALPPGARPARVVRHDGRTLLGITAEASHVLRPSPALDPQPTVGDWVAIPTAALGTEHLAVLSVLPRRSLLRRQSAGEVGEQALAANVDVVLITCGVDRPVRAGRVQRVATQAWDCAATPVLVLTKAADPTAVDLPRLELEHRGMQVLSTAALEGVGLDEVRALIAGRTAVLVGESGAGKSTLTNALLGRDVAATGAVRSGDAKGRHTTTARELHLLPGPFGGAIIDTPGLRSFGLAADISAVGAVFPEIQELATACRFSDCGHRTEPGCAVSDALDGGQLPRDRYESWLRLQRAVASAALRSSPHELRAYGKRFGRQAKAAQVRKRG